MTPTYRPRGVVQHLTHLVVLGAATVLHLAAELWPRRCRCDRCVARRLPRDGAR